MGERKRCKYYNPHMETINTLTDCLYDLEGCACGGILHILLDDGNIDDDDITFCMKECMTHTDREESKLGKLICEEYLLLSMQERRFLTHNCDYEYCPYDYDDEYLNRCKDCYIETGIEI